MELLQSGQTRECPLCNSPLDPTRREGLLQRFQDEIQQLHTQIAALQKQIEDRDKRRGELLAAHQAEEKNRAQKESELNRLLLLETNLPACEADLNRALLLEEEIKQLAESLEKTNSPPKPARNTNACKTH
jgi:DNA repair exonuclease SbcCD ATPase subunit